MAQEIYQIDSAESLDDLIRKINVILFEISKRLANLNIPNSAISTAADVDDLISALQSAGIGSE
jgi:hypothetical protein